MRRRLMVIDDNKDGAESMSMLFELRGREVLCAYDGRAALETAGYSRGLKALGGWDSQRAQTRRRCCADRNPDFAATRSRSSLLWVTSSLAKAKRMSCT